MPHTFNETDLPNLAILGLTLEEVQDLPEEKQRFVMRQAWRKSVLRAHPDKNGETDDFLAVNEAYQALTGRNQEDNGDHDEINHYFSKQDMVISDTAFDFLMEEGIRMSFDALKEQFRSFELKEDKEHFAQYYAPFFNLAETLEKKAVKEQLMTTRSNALYYQEFEESWKLFLKREWNMLIIRLFGEEYLDDIQYREAIASGSLRSILATRKLLSPFKWVAFITGSMDLPLNGLGDYYFMHRSPTTAYLLYTFGAAIGTIHWLANIMASPVNTAIRPLAEKLEIAPFLCTAVGLTLASGMTYAILSGILHFSLASAFLFLPYLTLALNVYSIYYTYQTVKNLQARGIEYDSFLASMAVCILVNFIPSGMPILDFIFVIGTLNIIHIVHKTVNERPIETLPLPTEPMPASLKEATLLGYTQANQSHLFFKTPKEAKYQNHRTFFQKMAGFFGHEYSAQPKSPPSSEFTSRKIDPLLLHSY